MESYKLTNYNTIIRESDQAIIPIDIGNRDYREFLRWTESGNTPEQPDVEIASPNWTQFLIDLKATSIFNQLKQLSRSDIEINALSTELRISLGESALGMADIQYIQELLTELDTYLTEQQRTEILQIIASNHIPLTL